MTKSQTEVREFNKQNLIKVKKTLANVQKVNKSLKSNNQTHDKNDRSHKNHRPAKASVTWKRSKTMKA